MLLPPFAPLVELQRYPSTKKLGETAHAHAVDTRFFVLVSAYAGLTLLIIHCVYILRMRVEINTKRKAGQKSGTTKLDHRW